MVFPRFFSLFESLGATPAKRSRLTHPRRRVIRVESLEGRDLAAADLDFGVEHAIPAANPAMFSVAVISDEDLQLPADGDFEPRAGDTTDLGEGRSFQWDSPNSGWLVNADGSKSRFIDVEVVENPNLTSFYVHVDGHRSYPPSAAWLQGAPRGKQFLGSHLMETGPWVPWIELTDHERPEMQTVVASVGCRQIQIYGVEERFDADGSGAVGAGDLAAVLTSLSAPSDNSQFDPAHDVDRDGAVTLHDLLDVVHQMRAQTEPQWLSFQDDGMQQSSAPANAAALGANSLLLDQELSLDMFAVDVADAWSADR